MTSSKDTVLVIGALGQLGSELTSTLRNELGPDNVIAADVKFADYEERNGGPFFQLDVLDKYGLAEIVRKNNITQVYHMAAYLSAKAELNLQFAWKLNMEGLYNVLEVAREASIEKIFWPSSIAVFGPNTPKENTPQNTITDPNTVYGISKLAGERWVEYYNNKFGLDIRSLRYPGIISYKTLPGGGTTDYAVHIFYEAVKEEIYECFLNEDTELPMMYIPDAIKATIELMTAPTENIKVRSSYNITAMSFTPADLVTEIQKHIPSFQCTYSPDKRQKIADSWPKSIDDSTARNDWNWNHEYDLAKMTEDMIVNIKKFEVEKLEN